MADQTFDPDAYTKGDVITKSYYRDVYPAVDPTRAELSQTGKVTVITGAGKGIGAGIATAHAKTGVRGLVLVSRSVANLEKVKDAIQAKHPSVDILNVAADVADEKAVDELFAKIKERYGTADTLIHNAGTITTPFGPVGEVSPGVWWNDFNVNVKGAFLVSAAFMRLAKQASDAPKTVVNLVTNVNLAPPTLSSYFSSKAAVMKFTEVLQAENPDLAAYTLNPGIVSTDLTLDAFKPYARDTRLFSPPQSSGGSARTFADLGEADLIGSVTAYLSAKRPEYLRGRHVNANWDLEELEGRKGEIVDSDMLKMSLRT